MNTPATAPHALQMALTGRQQETDFLLKKLDQIQQGQGAVTILLGEAGMGKTRLVEETLQAAGQRDLLVLRGAGDARDTGLAYGMLVEVLLDALEHLETAETQALQQMIAGLAPHLWDFLFPDDDPPATGEGEEMNPELRQTLFLARLGRFLMQLSQRRPLVLCLEDLHWADSASLLMLSYMANRNAEIPLLVLGTSRPEVAQKEGMDLKGMLQVMHSKDHFYALRLKPLSPEQIGALLATFFGKDRLSLNLIKKLHQKSGGVPLYLVQYLETLREKGLLRHKEGQWHAEATTTAADVDVPESVRDALLQRLEGLEEDEREVLVHAAIQGDTFEGRLVARTIGWPSTQVLRLLSKLTRQSRLVVNDGRKFRFAHSQLTETCYQQMSDVRRTKVHLRLGNILEEHDRKDVERIAYHLFQGGAFERALPHLLVAAERAKAAHAYREAQQLITQAAQALDTFEAHRMRSQRVRLLLIRTEVEGRTQSPAQVMQLCRDLIALATATDNDQAKGRALMHMGTMQARQANWPEATRLFEEAMDLFAAINDDQNCATAYVRLGTIAYERGDLDTAAQRFNEAKATAHRDGNGPLLGTAYGNLGIVASVRGDFTDAILNYTEALKAYRKINHTYGMCQTMHNLGLTHALQQEWDVALKCYTEGQTLAEEMGTTDVLANILVSMPATLLGLGQLDEAEAACDQARLLMDELGDRLGRAECDKVEGIVCRHRKKFTQAEDALLDGLHLFRALENELGEAECELELGRLFQTQNNASHAQTHFQKAGALFHKIGAEADARTVDELLAA